MKLHISSALVSSRLERAPDRQGLLYKKSSRSSSYHPCWCTLWGNVLFRRERAGDRDPPKLIILEGCTVELLDSTSEPYAFEISYPCGLPGSRAYQMAAENQETLEGWVRALSTAGFGYLRALAAELEGQFRMLKNQPPLKLDGAPVASKNCKLLLPKLVAEMESKGTNFSQLHQEFGEDIVRLRYMWQEKKAGKKQPTKESLIDLG
ncbi:PREDICTED: sesquipedalian-1-like [Gekko japonicus]|uniref:Sesquipedalian n=1 Tax=Gekko japonicus TaxID=146911 RepID=A0ABM1JK85_GEKJA|nr:PREDICTED: sesquipedalian-1-like [Gekko japonicus]XP_015261872.1 PREDICTED: sesquipedalian-1-like [Gekko japonicus]